MSFKIAHSIASLFFIVLIGAFAGRIVEGLGAYVGSEAFGLTATLALLLFPFTRLIIGLIDERRDHDFWADTMGIHLLVSALSVATTGVAVDILHWPFWPCVIIGSLVIGAAGARAMQKHYAAARQS